MAVLCFLAIFLVFSSCPHVFTQLNDKLFNCGCKEEIIIPPMMESIVSPLINDRGDWGEIAMCDNGSFVNSMTLKWQRYHGKDDSGLNGIRLFCGRPRSIDLRDLQRIDSLEGSKGTWREDDQVCQDGEVVVGFDLRIEPDSWEKIVPNSKYPISNVHDHTGATGLRLICSGSRREILESGGPMPWGFWTGPQLCRRYQGVCGFRTQVELSSNSGDYTGLNNVQMFCCGGPPLEPKRNYVCGCVYDPTPQDPQDP